MVIFLTCLLEGTRTGNFGDWYGMLKKKIGRKI